MTSGADFMVRAFAVHQFAFGVKPFAAETVKAFVFTEVDVAAIIYFLQDLLDHGHVAGSVVRMKSSLLILSSGHSDPEQGADPVDVGPG
jgi:hypothetical protein